ncbi:GNAT family N-acetyltransferase [Kineococcus sp. R86509]|uniref:GNAT family N-acetyltransferase n=1 Tax=Kineococcus sp. R86509 TaxID=3093851 RepID=UPI0036D376D8
MAGLRKRTEADTATVVRWIPDAAALYRFAGPWLTWPLTTEQLNDVTARPGATAWVLDSSDGVAGHVQLTPTDHAVRLGRVLVDPAQRGRGLGRQLVALAVEQARSQGAGRVDLGVLGDNWSARRIYEALGFVPAADPEPSGVIMMTRPL